MAGRQDEQNHSDFKRPFSMVETLEHGDGIAHILVAILLLLLAVGVLISSTISFVHEVATTPFPPPNVRDVAAHSADATGGFVGIGLRYLSDILFGVIVLELLSTILTYIRARSLEATIKEFLIVGLISSIRKILLIGAQSSLNSASPDDFVKEAIGTILSIIGILLLIGGLLLLDHRAKTKSTVQTLDTDIEPA